MNKLFPLFGFLLIFHVSLLGQPPADSDKNTDALIRKQLVVNDLENQIKSVPFAAVRVYARYLVASWIWKDRKDDTGRAEEIAVAAIDDHYRNKSEIPPAYYFLGRLLALLDANTPERAKAIRVKYKTSANEESSTVISLLDQDGGAKAAVDAAINLLSRNQDNSHLVYLLMRLEQENSPEINRLLLAILAADGSGTNRIPTHMVEILTGFFMKPSVPGDIRTRFIKLVIARSRNVAALSELDKWAYYRTLQRLWPEIVGSPELLAEASTAHSLLSAAVSRDVREGNERYEKIQNSPDKLAATVAEAERAEDDTTKYALYRSAAKLALDAKKFLCSVDLMAKAAEIYSAGKSSQKEKDFEKGIHDQFYREVVTASLKGDQSDAAGYAVKKMDAVLSKANSLGLISKYFLERGDLDSGRRTHDDAIKILSNVEITPEGVGSLLRMLPTAKKIDADRVRELGSMIAKAVNAIPSLNPDDKPESENYKAYVTKVMIVNWNLHGTLTELVQSDRNAAADLAGRIDKKEVRLIGDFVLATDSIDRFVPEKKAPSSGPQL